MIKRLIKSFTLKPLPIYVGLGFIGFQGYRINKDRFNQPINFDYDDGDSDDGTINQPTKFEVIDILFVCLFFFRHLNLIVFLLSL